MNFMFNDVKCLKLIIASNSFEIELFKEATSDHPFSNFKLNKSLELYYESSTPTYRELSSLIFQSLSVCQSVHEGSVTPVQVSTFSIYNGINALH